MAFSSLKVVPGNHISTFPSLTEIDCIKVRKVVDCLRFAQWQTAVFPLPSARPTLRSVNHASASVRSVNVGRVAAGEPGTTLEPVPFRVRTAVDVDVEVDLAAEANHRLSRTLTFVASVALRAPAGAEIACGATRPACLAAVAGGQLYLAVGLELTCESAVQARLLVPSFGALMPAACAMPSHVRVDPAVLSGLRCRSLDPPPSFAA